MCVGEASRMEEDHETSKGDLFYEDVVEPSMDHTWHPVDVDRLISRLVKLRTKLCERDRNEIAIRESIGQALIGAGLVTGFLRENPLLSQHKKVDLPSKESGPKELFKYRKDLINSAMGSYCGGHTRRGHHAKTMATKYVRDGMNGSECREVVQDPIAPFNEDQLYKHRSQTIQAMLDSSEFGAEIGGEMKNTNNGSRGQDSRTSSGPDGVHPTFKRHSALIRSPITGDAVVFY